MAILHGHLRHLRRRRNNLNIISNNHAMDTSIIKITCVLHITIIMFTQIGSSNNNLDIIKVSNVVYHKTICIIEDTMGVTIQTPKPTITIDNINSNVPITLGLTVKTIRGKDLIFVHTTKHLDRLGKLLLLSIVIL